MSDLCPAPKTVLSVTANQTQSPSSSGRVEDYGSLMDSPLLKEKNNILQSVIEVFNVAPEQEVIFFP